MSVQRCGLSRQERLVVTPKEAWRLLGVSNSTGYELLAAGELDSIKFGRARRITMESIHALVARRRDGKREVA